MAARAPSSTSHAPPHPKRRTNRRTPHPSHHALRQHLSRRPEGLFDKTASYTHQVRSAGDSAAQAFPDFATNPGSLTEYAAQYGDVASRIVGGVDQLKPAPTGAEAVYEAYDTALHALTNALDISPDPTTIAAAQASYVGACSALQQYSDSNNIGVDLQCTGAIQPGSAADFFAAVAAAAPKLHTSADSAQSTFDALTPAQQADSTNLTVYAAGIGNAYGKAGQELADPSPPTGLSDKQKAIVDAANAVFDAGHQIQIDLNPPTPRQTSPPPNQPSPLCKRPVESACAQLQTAATAAGITTSLGCRL